MRFTKFTIKNFKGIENAVLDLEPAGGNVFTLIGLNESGKTTILEALNTFSIIKDETSALFTSENIKTDPASYVPKRHKSNFTGDILVIANIVFEEGDKEKIAKRISMTSGDRIDIDTLPDTIEIIRGFRFENSDFKEVIYKMPFTVQAVASGKRKTMVYGVGTNLWKAITAQIAKLVPQITYFPTFLFAQPDKIVLNPTANEKPVNKLYRQIIENIAASLPSKLSVDQHIVSRLRVSDGKDSDGNVKTKIIPLYQLKPDKQQQIEAALQEMEQHVSATVFNSWARIFGGDFSGREINLKVSVDENEDEETAEVYIQFKIKDRKATYDISERSLGFRWFFSFLLFTHYRTAVSSDRPVFFLLDEPASNLHARAQMQLLDSLPRIAQGSNQVMYSTHSHYLINPEWLDQSFIVSNKAIDYDHSDESDKNYNSAHTLVQAERYRNFVGQNPDKVTYFQPVLDKLDVVPSRLDLSRPSILMEGKGDFLLIEYVRRVILKAKCNIAVVPTRGATGMDELLGLFMGWGIPFLICLDDDKEGKAAQRRYVSDWGLKESNVWTLKKISPDLAGKDIHGMLQPEDLETIKKHFGISTKPTKSQISLFFSEHLAKGEAVQISNKLRESVQAFQKLLDEEFEASKVALAA